MYRIEKADQEFRDATRRRIEASAKRLQDAIRLAERSMRHPRAKNQGSAVELLAEAYNEFAWLIANTAGDYRQALRSSLKSLELEPGSGAYLDTLGRCYYAVGDLKNAVKTQKQAVDKAPYFQQIQRQLKFFEAELAKKTADQESGQSDEPPADA
jgi:tetratricopeptide (TPR) repeat protein